MAAKLTEPQKSDAVVVRVTYDPVADRSFRRLFPGRNGTTVLPDRSAGACIGSDIPGRVTDVPRLWHDPHTSLARRIPSTPVNLPGLTMSAGSWDAACAAPGPWHASQPMFSST